MSFVGLMGGPQCPASDDHQTVKISECGRPSDIISVGTLQLTGVLTEITSNTADKCVFGLTLVLQRCQNT